MVFKGICFVLIMLTTLSTNAQPRKYAHLSKEQKEQKSLELINEADYIVEGKTIDVEPFYGKDGKTIYSKYTIEVVNWYKGKGNKVINLIMAGGEIKTETADGDILVDSQNSHMPYLYLNTTYFMVLNDNREYEGYSFFDDFYVSFGRLDVGKDVYMRAFYELDFSSLDEFHSFISEAKYIKIPRKKKDAILGEYSKGADIEIDEIWLSGQGPFRAGVGEVLTIMGEKKFIC